jgi:hypothetical protein
VATIRRIDEMDELQRLAKVQDITYFELHGRRRDGFDASPKVQQGTDVLQYAVDSSLSVRFRTSVQSPDGTYIVDLSVEFEFSEPVEFDPDVMRAFASTIAFRIAYPFIREALRDMASKLGLKRPMLPLLPPDDVGESEPSRISIG